MLLSALIVSGLKRVISFEPYGRLLLYLEHWMVHKFSDPPLAMHASIHRCISSAVRPALRFVLTLSCSFVFLLIFSSFTVPLLISCTQERIILKQVYQKGIGVSIQKVGGFLIQSV